jgi:hypothetical protein
MNMKNDPPNDPQLSRTLKAWKMSSSLPPRFQEEVWSRIRRAEARPGFWDRVNNFLMVALPRPAVATAYVAVLIFAGLGTGWWQAREHTDRVEGDLAKRYVQAVDPYRKGH